MKHTYLVTRKSIKDWWGELSRKGHLIVLLFALGLLLTLMAVIASTYYAARSRAIYQQQVEDNTERIEGLEKNVNRQ